MSATVNALLREDLRDFAGYRSARSEALAGSVWLNANESAWANGSDAGGRLRRYPQPQPEALCARLAALYDVAPAQLLVGRGSDEAIDLLAAHPEVARVITHVIPADRVLEAFDIARNSQESGKVVVSLWLDN